MDEQKKTDEVVQNEQQTDVSQGKPENTPPLVTDEEVLTGLESLSKKHDESKPSRKEATIEKEAKKLESAIIEDTVDWDALSEMITDTDIGKKALQKFADGIGYTLEEVKQGLGESSKNKRFEQLQEEIQELKRFKEESEEKKETKTFVDFYKEKVSSYDMTPAEFHSLYGKDYENIFSKYVEKLGKTEAANIAFDMTIGKDKEAQTRIEEVKRKFRIKENVISPKPTNSAEQQDNKLKTFAEVQSMSDTERIAYKQTHWNKQTNMANYAI